MKAIDRQEILQRLWRGVPKSPAISRDLQHGCRSAAADMAFSMASVREIRRRPAFTRVVFLTSYLTNRCFIRRNNLTTGLRQRDNRVGLP